MRDPHKRRAAEQEEGEGTSLPGLPHTDDRAAQGNPLRNLRALAQDLSALPAEIRAAPERAARHPEGRMPTAETGRARRLWHTIAWPVGVVAASAGAAAALNLISR